MELYLFDFYDQNGLIESGFDYEVQNISEKKFEEFIDLCFSVSNFFTFKHSEYTYQGEQKQFPPVLKALEQYLVNSYYEWDSGILWEKSKHGNHYTVSYKTYVYPTSEDTKNIILKYCDNIFLKSDDKRNLLPEDLSFFIKGAPLLDICSHESQMVLYAPNKLIEEKFAKFGRLMQTEYWKKHCKKKIIFNYLNIPNPQIKEYELSIPQNQEQKKTSTYIEQLISMCFEMSAYFGMITGYTHYYLEQKCDHTPLGYSATMDWLAKLKPYYIDQSRNHQVFRKNSEKDFWRFLKIGIPEDIKLDKTYDRIFEKQSKGIPLSEKEKELYEEENDESIHKIFSSSLPYVVEFYKANNKSKEIMAPYLEGILVNKHQQSKIVFPQDICFFNKKGELILGISPEDCVCHLFIRNKKEEKFFQIPLWKEIEYNPNEDIFAKILY